MGACGKEAGTGNSKGRGPAGKGVGAASAPSHRARGILVTVKTGFSAQLGAMPLQGLE